MTLFLAEDADVALIQVLAGWNAEAVKHKQRRGTL